MPPLAVRQVSYVCSRFYRAPELILGAVLYTSAIDMCLSHLPLLMITSPYTANYMGACSAKGEWSLLSLSPSLPPSRLSAPC